MEVSGSRCKEGAEGGAVRPTEIQSGRFLVVVAEWQLVGFISALFGRAFRSQ